MFKFVLLLCAVIAVSMGQDCDLVENEDVEQCCKSVGDFDLEGDIENCNDENAQEDECEIYTCIMRETKALKSDGKVDRAIVQAKLMKNKDPAWTKTIETTVKKCGDISDKDVCPPRMFINCYVPVMFINCPQTIFNKTENCEKTRQYFDKCVTSGIFSYSDSDDEE